LIYASIYAASLWIKRLAEWHVPGSDRGVAGGERLVVVDTIMVLVNIIV